MKFDGVVSHVGGQGATMFPTYNPTVIARLAVASPLAIEAHYVVASGQMTVSATVTVDQALAAGSRRAYVVVTEDGAHGQKNLARYASAPEPFTLTGVGQTMTVVRTCTLNAAWDVDHLRPVVLVEETTGGVLQAAYATAAYAGNVAVNVTPAQLAAPWRLRGPEGYDLSGTGSAAMPVFATGAYTLTWQAMPGWEAPSPGEVTANLTDGGLLTFAGAYTNGPFTVGPAGALADDGPAAGVSLVDFDNDGDLDIFLARPGVANRLLRQDAGLAFTDIASGDLAAVAPTVCGAWADYDGDGDQDVFLVRDGAAGQLLQQSSPGVFTQANVVGLTGSGNGRAAGWVDYDRDGQLDLNVVRYNQANQLYRCVYRTPDLTVYSAQSGLVADAGPGMAASWCDYDRDGDDDVFLVNSFAANRLIRSYQGQAFEDATMGLLGEVSGGSSAVWGDADGDGWFDLLVANAGGAARLFRNTGGDFTQVPDPTIGQSSPTRAALMFDHDLDGNLDVYLCRYGASDVLLRQEANGTYTTIATGWAEAFGPSTAAACGDIDGDGDLDIYVARHGAPNALLLNDTPRGHWLQLRLRTATGNADAIGARVRVVAGGRSQIREVRAGGASLGQDALAVHFGLGATALVDSLFVTWPDHTQLAWTRLAADRRLTITEGDSQPVGAPDVVAWATALAPAHPNPFNPRTTLAFTLARAGLAQLDIYDLAGRHVRALVSASLDAGRHAAAWDGTDDAGARLPSGAYLARLRAEGHTDVQKLLLAK